MYIMYDPDGTIIYIGKAISLKNRVRQYFNGTDTRAMIANLVPRVAHIECIVTDSEMEALVLENNLIKEHRPKYNTLLKDDKTYPYIKLTVRDDYPRLALTRKMKRDGCMYFGPYTDAGAVRDIIDLLSKTYGLRTCSRKITKDSSKKTKACLNAHMGYCPAPCEGLASNESYGKSVEKVTDFLSGRDLSFIKNLEEKMKEASARMDFEEAAVYKDHMENAQKLLGRQKVNSLKTDDRDMVAVAFDEKEADAAVISVFFVRNGKLMGRDNFYMDMPEGACENEAVSGFVRQYYATAIDIPDEICLENEIPEMNLIADYLSEIKGTKVQITLPQRGDKKKLLNMAKKNSDLVLGQDKEKLKRERLRTLGASNELGKISGAGKIHRVEAYDISNISGYDMVGSMVVFEDGRQRRNDYRKFRIRSLDGPNDYAAMREVLTRRFSHGIADAKEDVSPQSTAFSRFPDLILMDGGKGQVNIALEVLSELNLSIPVCGMVKDDHHRTRGLYVNDEEVEIAKDSAVFHLITRIQDEAHRFAITYHRSLRSKGMQKSSLDMIPGIGPKRRKALMKTFSTIDDLKNATVQEIAAVPGMTEPSALNVYSFLHGNE